MKILLVITGLGMGGAERQICDLADGFASLGYEVKIAYLLKPIILSPKSNKVEVVWLGANKGGAAMVKALYRLIKLIKVMQPDVVHSHMFHSNVIARLARVFHSTSNFVNTAHNISEGGRVRMLIYRLTNFLADTFTNVSQEAVEAFELKKAVPKNMMLVTHNGIDTERFTFFSNARKRIRGELGLEDKKVFIAIGRFHKQKDYPNLLRSFAILCKKDKNVHLIIVGDGELRGQIELTIKEYCLDNNVSLLGLRSDVPELLSASDVFVLSSAWEGFGLVVAEAMACERVVVATNCGGVAEVLGNEGLLVKPNHNLELASAMEKSISFSDNKRLSMGASSRNRVIEKYSLKAAIDNWLVIYKSKNLPH